MRREFETEAVHQGYIEPHAATAQWSTDGYVTIWCSSQGHFSVRDHTSNILGLPVSRVKVIPMEIGGGFGGKGQGGVYLEPLAAKLSQISGQPVKIVMSRTEVFVGTGPDVWNAHLRQAWERLKRRTVHGRRGPPDLRGGSLPRLAGRWRLPDDVRPIRHPQRARRGRRRTGQQAEVRRISRARIPRPRRLPPSRSSTTWPNAWTRTR